jgi:RNA polymerase sigma-70 factor, ECF subfamily
VDKEFEALFREHYARLCEFVYAYVRSTDVAHDLVQDLFLTLWEKRRAPGQLTTAYLYAAARNRARKHLRHQRVVKRFEDRAASLPARASGGTDHDVRYRETAEAVDAAIADLPERCREIFVLSRRQHMSYADIAAALDISVKTVEVQMWRALRKLRKSLASYLTALTVVIASGPGWPPLSG